MLLFFSTILVLIIIVLLSELYIEIKQLELLRINKTNNLKYTIKIRLKFLGKVSLIGIALSSQKKYQIMNKNYLSKVLKAVQGLDNKKDLFGKKTLLGFIQELHKIMKIKQLKFNLNIDTENVILNSAIVAIISIIVPNIIRNHVKNLEPSKFEYKIYPIYKEQNQIQLKFNSIISIKVVHIISMLKVIGGKHNERSSNRKLNVKCYGKY